MTEDLRLWHVSVTVSGRPLEPPLVRAALVRLAEQRPFMLSLRYAGDRAEVRYWEEAVCLLDASSLALRLWDEHRASAGLPAWEVVGLEVLERSVYLGRGTDRTAMVHLHDVTPQPF